MARPPARPDALTGELLTGRHTSVRTATERLIAVGYGLTYDAVVSGFPPYERLLEEIATLVGRSAPAGRALPVPRGPGRGGPPGGAALAPLAPAHRDLRDAAPRRAPLSQRA